MLIKKLKSIAAKLDLKIEQDSKKIDLGPVYTSEITLIVIK
jgi:hypothetical protein